MSLADQIFVDMCNDIINNGVSTEGEKGTSKVGRRKRAPIPSRNLAW